MRSELVVDAVWRDRNPGAAEPLAGRQCASGAARSFMVPATRLICVTGESPGRRGKPRREMTVIGAAPLSSLGMEEAENR
jgi:hypothetical protein